MDGFFQKDEGIQVGDQVIDKTGKNSGRVLREKCQIRL